MYLLCVESFDSSIFISIGIITHQSHISKVNANDPSVSHSLTYITSIASCDAKKDGRRSRKSVFFKYVCVEVGKYNTHYSVIVFTNGNIFKEMGW